MTLGTTEQAACWDTADIPSVRTRRAALAEYSTVADGGAPGLTVEWRRRCVARDTLRLCQAGHLMPDQMHINDLYAPKLRTTSLAFRGYLVHSP